MHKISICCLSILGNVSADKDSVVRGRRSVKGSSATPTSRNRKSTRQADQVTPPRAHSRGHTIAALNDQVWNSRKSIHNTVNISG